MMNHILDSIEAMRDADGLRELAIAAMSVVSPVSRAQGSVPQAATYRRHKSSRTRHNHREREMCTQRGLHGQCIGNGPRPTTCRMRSGAVIATIDS
jgi:hypothetical protein